MVDPRLKGQVPAKCLHQAVAVTAMCLQEQPSSRPHISDIVVALEYLAAHSNKNNTTTSELQTNTNPTKNQLE